MGFSFETAGTTSADRLGDWKDVIWRHQCEVDCEPIDESNFQGRIAVTGLGPGALSTVESGPVSYRRGGLSPGSASEDHFLINLPQSSRLLVEKGDEQTVVERGDMILSNMREPFRMSFPEPARNIVLRVPRERLAASLPRPDEFAWRSVNGRSGLGALIRVLLIERAAHDDIEPSEDAAVFDVVLDLLATLLAKGRRRGFAKTGQDHLRLAKCCMQKRLGETDLNAERVANEVGVSVRSLYRLFAEDQTTFQRWLMIARLDASHRALAEGRCSSVTDAALTYGFKELSHFSRSFRERFHCVPRSLQRS